MRAATSTKKPRAKKKEEPNNDRYDPYLLGVQQRFALATKDRPLFTTDCAEDLWRVYLKSFPVKERQHHTCHACRHFIERYGHLVTIDSDGKITSPIWGEAPGIYRRPHIKLRARVEASAVTGVFYSNDQTLGTPHTGAWHHLAVSGHPVKKSWTKTAGQMMAEKAEEYGMLCRGLAEFSMPTVGLALKIIEAEVLYRNEKVEGVARWLLDLHAARAGQSGRRRDNVTWLAVATAPPGYAHVRTTMIGTLLEDVALGLPFDVIAKKFKEKMSPLQYQRPQVAPTAGNLARAEKLVRVLGAAGSLARRFARYEDIQEFVWQPREVREIKTVGSVFGHIKPKDAFPVQDLWLPTQPITWEKFRWKALQGAREIEVLIPYSNAPLIALCSAVNPLAPPILQWDSEEKRNPVNWYVYPGGSPPGNWNLRPGCWVKVTGITGLPFMWGQGWQYDHQGEGVVLLLDGCKDLHQRAGAALFPEVLRNEFREISASIEAFSRAATLAGVDQATACGWDIRKTTPGQGWKTTVRVTDDSGVRLTYEIDRWE
jgi:hypothetical protein